MIAVVCASGIRQRSVRTDVDRQVLCKFDFRTVIDTGNAAEGEHQVQILLPCANAQRISGLFHPIRTVIPVVHADQVPGRIVYISVFSNPCPESIIRILKIPHHGEIKRMHTAGLAVVRSMIGNAVQQRVVTGESIVLFERIVRIVMINGSLNVCIRVFIAPFVLPFRLGFRPGIEGNGLGRIIIEPHTP